jgi:hypothetical protein
VFRNLDKQLEQPVLVLLAERMSAVLQVEHMSVLAVHMSAEALPVHTV